MNCTKHIDISRQLNDDKNIRILTQSGYKLRERVLTILGGDYMLQKIKDHFVTYEDDGAMTITLFSSISEVIILALAIVAVVEFIMLRKRRK